MIAERRSTGFSLVETRFTLKFPQFSLAQVKPLMSIPSFGSIVPFFIPMAAVTGFRTDPGAKVALNRLRNGSFSSSFNESHLDWLMPYAISFGSNDGLLTSAYVSPVFG